MATSYDTTYEELQCIGRGNFGKFYDNHQELKIVLRNTLTNVMIFFDTQVLHG